MAKIVPFKLSLVIFGTATNSFLTFVTLQAAAGESKTAMLRLVEPL